MFTFLFVFLLPFPESFARKESHTHTNQCLSNNDKRNKIPNKEKNSCCLDRSSGASLIEKKIKAANGEHGLLLLFFRFLCFSFLILSSFFSFHFFFEYGEVNYAVTWYVLGMDCILIVIHQIPPPATKSIIYKLLILVFYFLFIVVRGIIFQKSNSKRK